MTEKPRLPTSRDAVVAHCRETIPGFDELEPEVRARTISFLLDLAGELNDRVEEWDALPHDVWADVSADLDDLDLDLDD